MIPNVYVKDHVFNAIPLQPSLSFMKLSVDVGMPQHVRKRLDRAVTSLAHDCRKAELSSSCINRNNGVDVRPNCVFSGDYCSPIVQSAPWSLEDDA